ncbi:DUF3783 domain-containing protein [Clostridium botulinum]|nr:DUF3783 domain-containing protein [Clostridium botulinum]
MINNKLMLVYGFEEEEINLLKNMYSENNLPTYKIVNKNMGKMKLRDIISGISLEVEDIDMPEEKVIIFNNFSDNELELGIKKLKEILKPVPIMAVVTDTSIEWEFKYLLDHLMEEREWHIKQQNK